MFKRKSLLFIILVFLLVLPTTMVAAQEVLAETQADLMEGGLSIPERDASTWALDELVDSDRYGLYIVEDLYKNNLRNLLDDELKENLLKNFKRKLEETNLDEREKADFFEEVKDSKTRGDFLRQIYNVLLSYEDEENLRKDPIIYLRQIDIVEGNGKELFLDRDITIEEGILFIKRAIDYVYSENKLDSKGLMWKVENEGNTVYLLGSIHLAKPELYPFKDHILDSFYDSEKLYVEVDISNEEELMKAMMEQIEAMEEEMDKANKYEDTTTLESVIDGEIYSKIEIIMEKYNIPEEEYKNLKIQGIKQKLNEIISDDFFANMLDEVDEDFDLDLDLELEESMDGLFDSELMKLLIDGPKFGIDFYFLDKAKILNKEVGELESIESQMDLLFGGGLFEDLIGHISEEEEIKILEEVLEAFDKEGNILEEEFENDEKLYEEIEQILQGQLDQELNMLKEMFDAIKLGDSEKLAKAFMESEGAGMLGGELMGQRDKNMAKKIAGLLEGEGEKTYFIVVGAAHFVVDGTILDNLIDMGYEIEEIK